MKKLIAALGLTLSLGLFTVEAQSVSFTSTNLLTALQFFGVGQQVANGWTPGTPLTVQTPNGIESFTYSVNNGLYTVTASGNLGNASLTVPNTATGASATWTTWLAQNNPANITYYGTNEIEARVGAGYVQNTGQAVAVLSVQKYGLFGQSNVGLGGGLLQGQLAGKSGTAGMYGELDYRKAFGDVAAVGGLIGGWDNWDKQGFGGVKGGLEYRQSSHLGEFLDVAYAYEANQGDKGLLIFGGITFSF